MLGRDPKYSVLTSNDEPNDETTIKYYKEKIISPSNKLYQTVNSDKELSLPLDIILDRGNKRAEGATNTIFTFSVTSLTASYIGLGAVVGVTAGVMTSGYDFL